MILLWYSSAVHPRAKDFPDGGWNIDTRYAVPNLFFQAYNLSVALRPDAVSPAG